MAKVAREQAVRERRLRKQEKKQDKKQAAAALRATADGDTAAPVDDPDTSSD